MTQQVTSARIVVYITIFMAIFVVFTFAGYLAVADREGQTVVPLNSSPFNEPPAGYQPIGSWFHRGSDPLLGPFEENLDLMSVGTFRSEIHAPSFAEDLIIIRGFWRRGEDSFIGLYVSNCMVNEIHYDPSEDVFVNAEGYRYARIYSRDIPERMRGILFSSHPCC